MFDIKWIRENPEAFDAGLTMRNLEPLAADLLALDEKHRACVSEIQEAQTRRNAASKEIGKAMGAKDIDLAERLKKKVSDLKQAMQASEEAGKTLGAELKGKLAAIPNMPLDDVPVGVDEDDNVFKHASGQKPQFTFQPKEHYELGENLNQMDFDVAAKISGSRFVVLNNAIARLERALGQFMLDTHTTEHGYSEVSVPLLVRDEALYGTGQLPKFAEDLFQTTDGRWLIPTAEVPLTNLVSGEILEKANLPLRYTALTPCFRSEAGSAGRDTRGMLRQHQFWKVELVSITDADSSLDEHERMIGCAENILKKLGLHYQVVNLSTGDLGFGARKTYDIEVWMPGQDAYREISSCSVCGDFQARRMNARYRDDDGIRHVHTLNGSGIATGRALIAVMENYQNEDGSITVPEVLLPYMGGIKRIEKLK
ncbi:MAG: serine--tRNA ligase [Rhizobiaceae bacterium]|nr:serine--tRNA ligase [Rhizobiaceae bacterium]